MKKLVKQKRALKHKKAKKENLAKLSKIIKKQINIINQWMTRLSMKKKADPKVKEQLSKKLTALEAELKAVKDFKKAADKVETKNKK